MSLSEEEKIYKKIAPTRDTHANWEFNNPVLPDGVMGIVKDRLFAGSLEIVIGDGENAYTNLPKSGLKVYTSTPQKATAAGSAGDSRDYAAGNHAHPRGPEVSAADDEDENADILAATIPGDIILKRTEGSQYTEILEILRHTAENTLETLYRVPTASAESTDGTPDKPSIVSVGQSADGTAVTINEPEIIVSGYRNALGVPCGGVQVVVTLADGETTVYDSGWIGAGRYKVPGRLTGSTGYKVKARYKTVNGDISAYSDAYSFTTETVIFGRAQESTDSYLWRLIDKDGNYLDESVYTREWLMNNFPPLSGIHDIEVDGQDMVEFPVYWAKAAVATSGDANGKFCYWISEAPTAGFVRQYGFYDPATGDELDAIQVGAYEASTDASASSKAASVAGKSPRANITVSNAKTMCTARNTGGVTGFTQTWGHLCTAVNALILLAYGSTDIQTTIGAGNTSSSAAQATGATNAEVFGLHEWWGNVWEMMDITYDTTTAGGVVQIVKPGTAGLLLSLGTTYVKTLSTGEYITELDDEATDDIDKALMFMPVTSANTATHASSCIRDHVANYGGSEQLNYRGGYWDDAAAAGPWRRHWNVSASTSDPTLGFRLARVVPAETETA